MRIHFEAQLNKQKFVLIYIDYRYNLTNLINKILVTQFISQIYLEYLRYLYNSSLQVFPILLEETILRVLQLASFSD